MKKDEEIDEGAQEWTKVVKETIPILPQLSDSRHVLRHLHLGISTTSRLATSAPPEFTRV